MNTAGGVDVLFGHALFMALDPKQAALRRPYPPLGTLYAAAAVRDAGWSVALFDAMIAPGPEVFEDALDAHRPRLVVLFEDSFNFYSKMCLAVMRDAALRMVALAADRGLPTLVAGSDASDAPQRFLDAGAAAVAYGEADWTIVEAVRVLLGHTDPTAPEVDRRSTRHDAVRPDLSAVPGLVLAGVGGGIARTPPRPTERIPDRFPPPARDLVDLDAYRAVWRAAHGHWSLNAASTRGCPFHCNWCAKPIWGQRYAMRTPDAVADELAALKREHAPDHVWFADDIFGLRPEWTAAFGEAVAARGADLPFTIQSRVDLISDAAADGLARAGCVEVWLGVESGSQPVLDAMDKGIRAADVPAAAARLRARGIRVAFFLQLGYPGEEWADVEATAALVRAVVPDAIGVSVSYPLPGTPFHHRVADELAGDGHWQDSMDLAMLFQGTFTTRFYRTLHAQLHRELDARHSVARADAAGDAAAPSARAVAHAELDAAMAAWDVLAAEAAVARNAAPTRPTVRPPSAPPDLTASAG
ncbi:MAG: B12-binding domain-containing radical SAM protein [Ardenticatenales bacterium]|nr:B12-binding domain-containing radical SAM protein [Ardenticatenales bacterium]